VFDESWDNLIILDACRFDTFSEMNQIQGQLEYRISRGSSSEEFLLENFAKHPRLKTFPDLVYIAANPYVSSLVPNRFHKIYPVWDYGWDNALETVPPENVVKSALQAQRENPDKRLIIHFMQPHFPPLVGRIEGATGFDGLRTAVLKNASVFGRTGRLLDTTIENLLDEGVLNVADVWNAYRQNLSIVLSHVEKLLPQLDGTTVISSDHGNIFNERVGLLFPFRISGHRKNFHVKQLVKVPWLIVKNQREVSAPQINPITNAGDDLEDDERIKDRLRKLGYI
jgi:hypothetical protein